MTRWIVLAAALGLIYNCTQPGDPQEAARSTEPPVATGDAEAQPEGVAERTARRGGGEEDALPTSRLLWGSGPGQPSAAADGILARVNADCPPAGAAARPVNAALRGVVDTALRRARPHSLL